MIDQDFQAERSRSPGYPYLSLPEAVQLAQAFFEKFKGAKVPISIALKEMGYSATSGSGARVLSALTQFQLFDSEGTRDTRKISLTNLGLTIVRANPRDPGARTKAIQTAALAPLMHQWVYDFYNLGKEDLPTEEVFKYDLVSEKEFTERAATAFIKEFLETYQYARLSDRASLEEGEESLLTGGVRADLSSSLTAALPKLLNDRVPSGLPRADTREFSTGLTQGKTAHLIVPQAMNRKDFQLLMKWLDLLSEAELYDEETDTTDDNYDQQTDA